ncbi:LacI family DNA-binding transcriptional regulator [Devosia sp. MC532]|uniref:substrate-binding domain-containing protein n=1 Tax=Devosia sp. MC532 TaxID=2799788 RepID=UPI0018F41D1A|nr:LacI family DNA-binding transcriptional regulator [Devosia sp. MC532]
MSAKKQSGNAPTLADVARAAGVSVSTAARVLRGDSYPVDPALAEAVKASASELRYVRNIHARNLRGGASTMMGLIVGDMLDPYYGEIAEAVTLQAETRHGLSAIVCNMQRDAQLELKYCAQLWEHRVGGIILAGGGFDQWSHFDKLADLVRRMQDAGVVVASLTPRGLDVPTFSVDHESLGQVMAKTLTDRGHRRVGILLGSSHSEATQQRLRGAMQHLAKSGAGFIIEHAEYNAQAGANSIDRLLRAHPDLTGVLVGSSAMAMGVLARLVELGISVPNDFSVVCAGKTMMTSWSSPKLTTVDLSLAATGRAATDFIASRIQGGEPLLPAEPLPLTLFEGESVTQPREGLLKL